MKISEVALKVYRENPYNDTINPEASMNISPFLSINHSCDEALQWSKEQLVQAGLHPVQTFDLNIAWAGLHDCSCPNHGTDKCDCQMVVMLVYHDAMEPATLILHGSNGQTWFSIVDNSNQKTNSKIAIAIRNSLEALFVTQLNST